MSHEAALGEGHGHGDHDHPPFLAHHFDDPEQQYDSGKLGMWLFLATEILFFSGMFCAYALYRSIHPEVWTFASQFLNETLGAFNTGVLLFSSLTMAWGVRCAQLRQRTGLVIALAMTLGCAAIFLGVKAIEYTHKWELGLLPAGFYESQYLPGAHHEGLSSWLYRLSAVPALCVVGFGIWYAITLVKGEKRMSEIAGPLLVTALCYFVGVGIGIAFENAEAHDDHAAAAHASDHAGEEHAAEEHAAEEHAAEEHADQGAGAAEYLERDDVSKGEGSAAEVGTHGGEAVTEGEHADADHGHSSTSDADMPVTLVSTGAVEHVVPGAVRVEDVDQRGGAGLFFSIYYCMTGVHAIHIIGGMIVLTWLLVRATRNDFNEQYFGPVDYVGLYWHIVDLIWIYLFPLLYLIK